MGYHLKKIKKGIIGEVSKIQEELDELKDALEQKNKVMALVELSDIILAMKLFLNKNFKGIKLRDIITMSEATDRAFKDGSRKN